MHTQGILATENCTHAHSGISNTYTYTNFVRNLGYLHNKVLHFMLIQVFFCYLKLHANSREIEKAIREKKEEEKEKKRINPGMNLFYNRITYQRT